MLTWLQMLIALLSLYSSNLRTIATNAWDIPKHSGNSHRQRSPVFTECHWALCEHDWRINDYAHSEVDDKVPLPRIDKNPCNRYILWPVMSTLSSIVLIVSFFILFPSLLLPSHSCDRLLSIYLSIYLCTNHLSITTLTIHAYPKHTSSWIIKCHTNRGGICMYGELTFAKVYAIFSWWRTNLWRS